MTPILLNKPLGLSPYQAIQQLKQQMPQLQSQKVSAAGRLDPMAEGLLLILVGPHNKSQAQYLTLPKVYQTTILLGLGSDSHDLLGIPHFSPVTMTQLQSVLRQHVGTIEQPYPPYSAVQVNGRPLYYWARHGLLNQVKIPTRRRTITNISLENVTQITSQQLLQKWLHHIDKVQGDFRQEAIKDAWHNLLQDPTQHPLINLTIECSSGTFIRGLAHSIGQALGGDGLALHIKRTQIGPYHLQQAITLNEYNI